MPPALAFAFLLTTSLSVLIGVPDDSYNVEPVRIAWSVSTSSRFAQVVTCNFDSLERTELFILARAGVTIDFWIREYPGGSLVASGSQRSQAGPAWISFDSLTFVRSFVRGRQYEFAFDPVGADSVRYFLNKDGYGFGDVIVGSEVRDSWDLAMRVNGLLNPVSATYFGAYPYFPMGGETWGCSKDVWKKRAADAGLHHARFRIAWAWVDSTPADTWRYAGLDTQYCYLKDSLGGCEVYANLYSCTPGTSTHYDRKTDLWSVDAPPCSLFLPVSSPHNYWARFVERTVRHYDSLSSLLGCDSIHTFEVWNEPNVLSAHWQAPTARDYSGATTVRARCSIYVRLCKVAHDVIVGMPGHEKDRILVGSLGDLENEEFDASGDTLIVKGKVWLRWMYEIARRPDGPGVFWNGVAFHYYDDPHLSTFEADAETLRAVMRANGDYGELWVTEVGWPPSSTLTEEEQADAVVKVFANSLVSGTRSAGGYDRVNWFCFRDAPVFLHGLADTLLHRLKPSFYSFRQVARRLTGRRPKGYMTLRNDGGRGSVWVCEFEDTTVCKRRLWLIWRAPDTTWGERRPLAENLRLAARTDVVEREYCAYDTGAPRYLDAAGADGWASVKVTLRPVFVEEVGQRGRPDLVVDSVRVEPGKPRVGEQMVIRTWVRNLATKESMATPKGMATKVVFLWDGDTLGYDQTAQQIGVGKTIEVRFPIAEVGTEIKGPALVKAVVNPEQRYVELNVDNNEGYRYVE